MALNGSACVGQSVERIHLVTTVVHLMPCRVYESLNGTVWFQLNTTSCGYAAIEDGSMNS